MASAPSSKMGGGEKNLVKGLSGGSKKFDFRERERSYYGAGSFLEGLQGKNKVAKKIESCIIVA